MSHRPIAFRPMRLALSGFFLAFTFLISGCAMASGRDPPPATQAEQFNDPLENVNRALFRFNDAVVDRFVLTPLGTAYRKVLPRQVRDSLHNFFRNLRSPVIFANDVLQGDAAGARNTLARFVINSSIGIGGLIDIAGHAGIPYHYQDFGVTFGVWGIGPGPYLVIPVLGPSDPRDLVGNIAETFGDPGNIVAARNGEHVAIYARGGASGVDIYARNMKQLQELKRTSIDYYAAIRSLYQQRRAALVERKGGALPPNPGLSSNGGVVAAEARLDPPHAVPSRLTPSSGRVADGAELFPPHTVATRSTPRSGRIAGGAELFPPPDLLAEGREAGGSSSH